MEFIKFSTLEEANIRSKYIYPYNRSIENNKPTHILRHDNKKVELREIKEKSAPIVCEVDIQDIMDLDKNISDIQFQYSQHFYINEKQLILIATKLTDGLETFLYVLDPLDWQASLTRIVFSRKLHGQTSNIFISKDLKNGDNDDYYIMTIGTMDSALYVARFSASDILKIHEAKEAKKAENGDKKKIGTSKVLTCGLARTDARNAITQEIIVLNNQSKTPANVYIICGGFNGIMDFFLLRGNTNIYSEIVLEYQRHDLLDLPSKMPIVSLQCLEIDRAQQQILLSVGQELFKPLKINRAIEPSMTMVKLNMKGLVCKQIAATKFVSGTHISPMLKANREDWNKFELRTCILNDEARTTQTHFDTTAFQFGEKINTQLEKPDLSELEDFCVIDEMLVWLLDKQGHHIVHSPIGNSLKRQLSNSDLFENSNKRLESK